MGFPDAQEVANAVENEGGGANDAGSPDLAPDAQAAPQITELDKLEKFKFENQEYTPEALKKAMLRQADYTRKTQEFSQERRFYDNLSADLRHVRENPALAQEFKRIYPEKFHQYLEYVSVGSVNTPQQAPQSPGSNQTQYAQIDPQLVSRFERVENTLFEKEVQAQATSLEAQEKEYLAKYPRADLEAVYSKAQAIIDRNSSLPKDEHVKFDAALWDRLYKQNHEMHTKRYESYYKENIDKQKQAGLKAKDSGLGGAMPGSSPAKYKTIREATNAALSELDS